MSEADLDNFTIRWFGKPLKLDHDSFFVSLMGCHAKGAQTGACVGVCCTLSHLAALQYAFSAGGAAPSDAVLIFEHDVDFGPAFFADSTLRLLEKAARDPDWQIIKLGECQTFAAEERTFLTASSGCSGGSGTVLGSGSPHAAHSPYEQLQRFDSFADLDPFEPRRINNYCAHAYVARGRMAAVLTATFPPRIIFDDLLSIACNGAERGDPFAQSQQRKSWEAAGGNGSFRFSLPNVLRYLPQPQRSAQRASCYRTEQYAYQQNYELESTIPTSIEDHTSPVENITWPTPYMVLLRRNDSSPAVADIVTSTATAFASSITPPPTTAANAVHLPDTYDLPEDVSRREIIDVSSEAAMWTTSQLACLKQNGRMDLCSPSSYCSNGTKATRFVQALRQDSWQPSNTFAAAGQRLDIWLPTKSDTGANDHWIQLGSCQRSATLPATVIAAFAASSKLATVVGCCQVVLY